MLSTSIFETTTSLSVEPLEKVVSRERSKSSRQTRFERELREFRAGLRRERERERERGRFEREGERERGRFEREKERDRIENVLRRAKESLSLHTQLVMV